MSKAIFKLNFDCGRMGTLEGVFISTKQRVKKLIESEIEVYFGEVLGKYSEVWGNIEEEEVTFISDDENIIKVLEEYNLTSGFNPFNYCSINYHIDGEDLEDITIDEIITKLLKQ